ncbi:CDK5 regulatory subunit-associated protein 3 [Temnothorax longispinosus]|uniref:CDK5 regulatory subunit-associated protein 3 n=1 Tax=Temnothorax longispinosus TaxID=300112 RepID=A0A4S2JM25_9HYME|nr:CDK5 regulatory subunit-associated protein 3 [Temnothorax longispinosus]
MDCWSVWLLLVSLLGALLLTGGVELTFELADNAKECFYQEIEKNVSSTLEFQVVTGGQYDVDVTLEAPNKEIIYSQVKTQFDSHSFIPTMSGIYKACFSNEFSTYSHKLVYMDFQVGDELPLPGLGEHVTVMTQMESSAQEVHKNLISILDYQTHHRLREAQGRKRAEELNERVLWWSVMETVCILLIAVGQEQDIPIDINAGKLLDWLINRRHCKKTWHTNILTIRQKINDAIQNMPAHDGIASLLSGAYINYFYCIKIVEILKETEADTKNLFGRYGSQRMKDWQEILRLYEKDNVYLAEAAQILIRNVNYEVPSIKKQIQKLEQSLTEFEKKEAEYKKSENIAHTEYNALCKQLGITGYSTVRRELMDKVKELSEVYQKVAEKTKSLDKVVEFYSAFVEFTFGQQYDSTCVSIIKYVIEKGNTTMFEYTYGEVPASIIEPPLNIKADEDESTGRSSLDTNVIDFGNLDLQREIDFGEEVDLDTEDDIDWGDENAEQPTAAEIYCNISLEESGIVVEASGHEGGVATGSEAHTILDNPTTRSEFINQLFELEAFMKLRLYEFKGDDRNNLLSFSQMQDASSILQLSTIETTQNMLDNIQQKLNLIDRMVTQQESMRQKQDDAQNQIDKLRPLLKLVVQRTKELQTENKIFPRSTRIERYI